MSPIIPKSPQILIDEFNNHPALKFANDTIAFQAARTGTSGYQGEEHLEDWLTEAFASLLTFAAMKGYPANVLLSKEVNHDRETQFMIEICDDYHAALLALAESLRKV